MQTPVCTELSLALMRALPVQWEIEYHLIYFHATPFLLSLKAKSILGV